MGEGRAGDRRGLMRDTGCGRRQMRGKRELQRRGTGEGKGRGEEASEVQVHGMRRARDAGKRRGRGKEAKDRHMRGKEVKEWHEHVREVRQRTRRGEGNERGI